jgi:hypothetical protein
MKYIAKNALLELQNYSEVWCDANFDGFGTNK